MQLIIVPYWQYLLFLCALGYSLPALFADLLPQLFARFISYIFSWNDVFLIYCKTFIIFLISFNICFSLSANSLFTSLIALWSMLSGCLSVTWRICQRLILTYALSCFTKHGGIFVVFQYQLFYQDLSIYLHLAFWNIPCPQVENSSFSQKSSF